jgi:hypothetical protein
MNFFCSRTKVTPNVFHRTHKKPAKLCETHRDLRAPILRLVERSVALRVFRSTIYCHAAYLVSVALEFERGECQEKSCSHRGNQGNFLRIHKAIERISTKAENDRLGRICSTDSRSAEKCPSRGQASLEGSRETGRSLSCLSENDCWP